MVMHPLRKLALLLLICVPLAARAQDAVDQQARAVLDRALGAYRAAQSYADSARLQSVFEARDRDGTDVGDSSEHQAQVAFARPNRLAVTADDFAIISSGEKLWLYVAMLGQYTEQPAPEKIDLSQLMEALGNTDPPHPVVYVMTHTEAAVDALFPMIKRFTAVTPETRDGQAGRMVTGIADAARIPAFAPAMAEVPFQLWFDDKTGLLRWLQLDLTGVARDSLGLAERRPDDPPPPPGMPAVVASARVTVDLNDIKLDTAVPASLFTYQPAEHVQKVAAFDWAGPDPQKLIGQPAPEFAGEDLDGKPLALPHFRGRVLVLDFWATWCVPCLMAMPQIQQLHDSYAEKPVTVLGVNQDNPQAKGRVRELIAERKYTFRHLMDPKSEVGRSFQVGGIPCTIVIDQQGVIRSVHVGFSPDLEKDLRAKIDELLKTN